MAVLFVGNTPADLALPASVIDTATTGRDTAYSPYSLRCSGHTPVINIPANGGTTFWFHFRAHFNNVSNGSGTASTSTILCYDANGNIIFDLIKNVNTYQSYLRLYASSLLNRSAQPFFLLNNITYFFDFEITVPASGGTMTARWYVNGALVNEIIGTNSGTVKTQPRQLVNNASLFLSNGSTGINMSEFIVTVDEPTLGMRLATLDPTSAGADAAWGGTLASLTDNDTGTGIVSLNPNERFSAIYSAYAGPSSPAGIRGLYLKAHPGLIAGGPTRLDQPVRISSAYYDGTAETVVSGEPLMRELTVNPATSAPWTPAAFAALEAGVRSAA